MACAVPPPNCYPRSRFAFARRVRTLRAMRLYLTSDTEWRDLAFAWGLVSQVNPTSLVLPYESTLAPHVVRTTPDVTSFLRRGQRPRGTCDLAVVLASGDDPLRFQREAVDAVVQLQQDHVVTVMLRERAGSLYERFDPVPRTTLDKDLRRARVVLLALLAAAPELRTDIIRTGTAVADAIRHPAWPEVAAAWSAVEGLRVAQPRIAPWLIQPDQAIGGWAAQLGCDYPVDTRDARHY